MVVAKITEKTIRALGIVRDFAEKQESRGCQWPWSGITVSAFGEAMWPDSPSARRYYRGGHGAPRGKGLWFCAGSCLRRLEARGLVSSKTGRYDNGSHSYVLHWHLTKDGRAVLEEKKTKGQGSEKDKRQAKGCKKAAKV